MYIRTKSLPLNAVGPFTSETLVEAIEPLVKELEKTLPEEATGVTVTVCLSEPVNTKEYRVCGYNVYVVQPSEANEEVVNTVHLGHGLGNLESFPGIIDGNGMGCLDIE